MTVQLVDDEFMVNQVDDINNRVFNGCRQLERIRDLARYHRVGPMGFLLTSLAHLACQISPHIKVDVGKGPGSLNLFVTIVGPPGSEKSRTLQLAKNALYVDNPSIDYETLTPGSGEGIIATYAPQTSWDEKTKQKTFEPGKQSVLWEESEVQNLAALKARQGATLGPMLTKLFTAELLSVTNKDGGMSVESDSYRACLVLGTQPGRADALLKESDQGFPQRFIWVDTVDPSRTPRTDYPEVQPPLVHIPNYPNGVIQGCNTAKRTMMESSDRGLIQGEFNGLDSHAMFARAKVAALLAVLRGHSVMEEDDWTRAGFIMSASAAVRNKCVAYKQEAVQQAREIKGKQDDAAERRMIADIQDKIRKMMNGDKYQKVWVNLSTIKNNMPGQRWRGEEFTIAIDRMVESGQLKTQAHPSRRRTVQYALPNVPNTVDQQKQAT